MAKLIQPPTDGERDDFAPASWALHFLGAVEGQESSLAGRAGSSEGGVTALAHTCSRWGVRPAVSPRAVPCTTAVHVDHQLMSWREQIAETCGKQLAWHGCEHIEHKHWSVTAISKLTSSPGASSQCQWEEDSCSITSSQTCTGLGTGSLFVCKQMVPRTVYVYVLCIITCTPLTVISFFFFCCDFLISMTIPYSQWHWQGSREKRSLVMVMVYTHPNWAVV